jgi:hypothetical protein
MTRATTGDGGDPLVWYFAYGSNMQRATFGGRRGITPVRALAARAPGWRLVFDKPGIVPGRRGFANIVRAPGEEVHGVAYEIRATDLAHVDLTEGVLIGNYARLPIAVETAPAPCAPLVAHALVAERRANDVVPSRVYMALVVEGALEHGLPAAWIERLRRVPAEDDAADELALRAFIDDALRAMRRPE